MFGKSVSNTDDCEWPASHRLIFKHDNTRLGQIGTNDVGYRPIVVVPQYSEYAERRAQFGQRCRETGGAFGGPFARFADDEVAGNQNDIGMF